MRMYPILARLLFPLVLMGLRWRARREPGWGRDLASRRGQFGALYRVRAERPLWIHAASVGEVNSARGLLQAVRARWPRRPLLLTAFTPSGCEAWQSLARDDSRIAVRPLPLDHPAWMARAFGRVRPDGLVLVETEIWPHMLGCAHRLACPVVMVSARVGARSVRGWERWLGRALLADILAPIAHVGAQTEADAARLRHLGALHVVVEGSLKWDLPAPDVTEPTLVPLRNALGERPNWLAASTHPGEEAMVLRAHQALRTDDSQWLLILAPRHPRRAEEVAALCATLGMPCARRSRGESIAGAAVWLIDTLGELVHFMAVADRVFMGGSLVPIGGHNLLEPAAARCPMLSGPHAENAQDIADALDAVRGLRWVGDADELAAALVQWRAQPAEEQATAERAYAAWQAGGGAIDRALAAIAAHIGSASTSPPAGRGLS